MRRAWNLSTIQPDGYCRSMPTTFMIAATAPICPRDSPIPSLTKITAPVAVTIATALHIV